MIEYSFSSIDPDNYSEVYCPVNYLGASEQVKWFASSIQSNCYVVVISEDDYITFRMNEQEVKVCLKIDFTSGEEAISKLNQNIGEITLNEDNAGRYYFSAAAEYEIVDMSYNYEQLLGFYYYHEYPIKPVEQDGNYIIKAKAVGYTLLSPVWYLLSNLGSPNAVNNRFNPWSAQYVSVAMRIMNSFTNEQPLQYSNSDYVTTSQASSLSNIRCKLVDGNLKPVKILVPLTVTITVQDVKDEQAEMMESFETMEKDMAIIKEMMIKQNENKQKVTQNMSKVEGGLTQEPVDLNVDDYAEENGIKAAIDLIYGKQENEEGETNPEPDKINPEENQPKKEEKPDEEEDGEKTESPTEAATEESPQQEEEEQTEE